MVAGNLVEEEMMIRLPITGKIREKVKNATEVPIALCDRFEATVQMLRAMTSSMKMIENRVLMHAPPLDSNLTA